MDIIMEIALILLPVIISGGIAIFVILRMKHKFKKGTLGKKKSKSTQHVLDSLIPLGMLLGCVVGVFINLYFSIPLLHTISIGAAIGFLFGYFAYEIYSKTSES